MSGYIIFGAYFFLIICFWELISLNCGCNLKFYVDLGPKWMIFGWSYYYYFLCSSSSNNNDNKVSLLSNFFVPCLDLTKLVTGEVKLCSGYLGLGQYFNLKLHLSPFLLLLCFPFSWSYFKLLIFITKMLSNIWQHSFYL